VFLHPATITALRAYEKARDKAIHGTEPGTFFVDSRGRPLDGHNLQHTFIPLLAAAGIQAPPASAPRGCTITVARIEASSPRCSTSRSTAPTTSSRPA
jgi:hypothetical protein